VLIAYLIVRKDWKRARVSFSLSVIIALPFMNLRHYGIPYEGFISSMMGGIDVSQIVMFFVSILVYLM
jgi:hypothetical protein